MRIPEDVMCDTRLAYLSRCVYGILALKVYRGNVSEVGQREIAEKLGTYQPNVGVALRQLAECGHIEIMGEGQRRRTYRLLSPLFPDTAKVTRMPKRGRKPQVVASSVEEVFG